MVRLRMFIERIVSLVRDAILTNRREYAYHINAGRAMLPDEAAEAAKAAGVPEEKIKAMQDWFKTRYGREWFEEWRKFNASADRANIPWGQPEVNMEQDVTMPVDLVRLIEEFAPSKEAAARDAVRVKAILSAKPGSALYKEAKAEFRKSGMSKKEHYRMLSDSFWYP